MRTAASLQCFMFFLLTSLSVCAWGTGLGEHNSYRRRVLFFLKVAEDGLLSGAVRYLLHGDHLRVGALSGKKQI